MNGRGEYATFGTRAGEAARAFKDWASADTGATVVGVAGGIALGEFLGSWIVTQFNIEEGWTKLIVKGIAKAGLSFLFYFVARRVNPGLGRVLCQGIAAGPLVSIVGDVIGQVVAPAFGIVPGGAANINIKSAGSTKVPANVGNRTKVTTHV